MAANPRGSVSFEELHGFKNWEGLVEPLAEDLREEIIKHGEAAQMTYEAFINDQWSRYRGQCRFDHDSLLDADRLTRDYGLQYLPAFNFVVPSPEKDYPGGFLDTPSHSRLLNLLRRGRPGVESQPQTWIGYIAISKGGVVGAKDLDILVVWRGTITQPEWAQDASYRQLCFQPKVGAKAVRVHAGFHEVYTKKEENVKNDLSAREQVQITLEYLLDKHSGNVRSITVTGHSLGGAMATLSAYDIVAAGFNEDKKAGKFIPVTAFTFASPRVGNYGFAHSFDSLPDLHLLRVANKRDIVPHVPKAFLLNGLYALGQVLFTPFQKLADWLEYISIHLPWSYAHPGVLLELDSANVDYFKTDVGSRHNNEGYLHMVSGYQSKAVPFENPNRDVALVNKGGDTLHPLMGIPPNWRQALQAIEVTEFGARVERYTKDEEDVDKVDLQRRVGQGPQNRQLTGKLIAALKSESS